MIRSTVIIDVGLRLKTPRQKQKAIKYILGFKEVIQAQQMTDMDTDKVEVVIEGYDTYRIQDKLKRKFGKAVLLGITSQEIPDPPQGSVPSIVGSIQPDSPYMNHLDDGGGDDDRYSLMSSPRSVVPSQIGSPFSMVGTHPSQYPPSLNQYEDARSYYSQANYPHEEDARSYCSQGSYRSQAPINGQDSCFSMVHIFLILFCLWCIS